MKLDREKLISVINERWTTKNCPMCGNNNWTMGEDIMGMVRVNEKNDIQLGGKITPTVPVICNNCGNTIFINPLVIDCLED